MSSGKESIRMQITAINKELRFLDKEFKTVNKYLIENYFLRNILRKINRNKRINTIKPSHTNACSFRNYLRKVMGLIFYMNRGSYKE